MKRTIIALCAIALLTTTACNKSDSNNAADFNTLKTEVLKDFTNNIAVPSYLQLDNASADLYTALSNLNANATEDNLTKARTAWKSMRSIWEQSEGFLFGPVEDNDYDPYMDTWPTDYAQMDSLLSSSNPLEVSDIKEVTLSLRGYHPIEYIIFGDHGSRTAASLTARQKKYMLSLATDLKDICHALYISWTAAPTNYAQQVINAGNTSTVYSKKQEVYLAITDGLIGICEEVGEGKIKEPYDAMNPDIVESPYSGNSIADFKNNIIGLQNVYLGKYNGVQGKGLKDLVDAKNKSLNNKLQTQMTTAINSFDNVTVSFEEAIFSQRIQVQNVMDALAALKTTLEDELKPFILQNIQD